MRRKRVKYPVTMYEGQRIRQWTENTVMVDFNALGQRTRKCFKTLAEAKVFIDQKKIETKNKGVGAFALVDRDRVDLVEGRKRIGDVPLSKLVDFWCLHHPAGVTKTVDELVDDFLTAPGRRGKRIVKRREATEAGHRWRLEAFKSTFGSQPVNEITTADIEGWLDSNQWQGINRRHYLAVVRAMFNHALRRKYVGMNPAEQIELPSATSAEPIIMTCKEVEKYLAAVQGVCPELLPLTALGFFCGLRNEEVLRLDWKNISLENKLITITGDVAKIQGHRRNVDMPDNLIKWIVSHARPAGPVWPFSSKTTLVRKRAEAREKADVEVPDNAGRHAFASYHLALHEDGPKTANQLGHPDTKLLMTTYRNITASDGRPITKKAGEAYFKIVPRIVPKTEGNMIQLNAKTA